MEKRIWNIIFLIVGILGIVITIKYYQDKIESINRKHKIENAVLIKVNETQYSKIVADSLTKIQMLRKIKELGFKNLKNVNTVAEIDFKLQDIVKKPDTIRITDSNIFISDYYPNKDRPFVNYTFKDSVGAFKFYPTKISIALSENKDGTWKVDTKMPEYFEITDINAVARPYKNQKKYSNFYIGGGITKQNDIYPFEVIGGIKVGRFIILGSFNTEGNGGIKTLYNL